MTSIPVQDFFEGSDAELDDALRSHGGGMDEYRAPAAAPGGAGADETAPIPGGGALLEQADPKKVFKAVEAIIQRQRRLAKNRSEAGKHYTRLRKGVQFSVLEKSEDRSIWKAALPPGIDDIGQPIPNKIDDLCNKVISQLLADPPLPNPKVDGTSDRDRGAADVAKKFLRTDGQASGTNDLAMFRAALQLNTTWGSAFAFSWVDPTGGGWRPKQIFAHPFAEDPEKPLMGPKMDPATNQPVMDPATVEIDPMTQQPIPGTGQPIMERSPSPSLRFVGEVDDPQALEVGIPAKKMVFVKSATEAARQWMPQHRRLLLGPNQVRTVPMTKPVAEADAVIVIMCETLAEARRRFKVLRTLQGEQLKKVVTWKPSKDWQSFVPEAMRSKVMDAENPSGVHDDTLMFWYHKFCRISGDYQDGAEIAVNGANGGTVLLRDTLRDDVELADGTSVPVLRDIPVAQFLGEEDLETGDPFGVAPIANFAGGNETYAHIWLAVLDALQKALNPNVYIPTTSTVTREDINRRDGTPIDIIRPEDQPRYEQPPQLPGFLPQFMERLEVALNSTAGVNETANALDSPYSISGKAKEIAIKQARTAIAQRYQNTVVGITTYWRHKLQLAQAKLTVPQQVKLSGVESAYKQPWWTGGDVVGISDVALEPGSFSMMQPMEKAQWIQVLQQNRWIPETQAGELVRASMTDDLGLPPDIHEEHINRLIADWAEGAPEGWEDAYAKNQQAQQAYDQQVQQATATLVQQSVAQGIDEQTATQQAQAAVQQQVPPPQLAPLYSPFEPRPADDDKQVAAIQYYRILRFQATVEYKNHTPAWRTVIDGKLADARQKAGIMTVADEQAAAQAQQQAQAQAAEAERAAKTEEREDKQAHEAEQKALDRGRSAADKAKAATARTDQATLRARGSQTSPVGT